MQNSMTSIFRLLPHFTTNHIYRTHDGDIIYAKDYKEEPLIILPIKILEKTAYHQIWSGFSIGGYVLNYKLLYHEEWQ
jgi:hypothetical protein